MARLALALILLSSFSWAHGDAAWIMNNRVTAYCCGPQDCGPVDNVTVDGDGWIFEGKRYAVGDPNVHPSINGSYWACRYPDGTVRCFFYVPPGF